MLQMIHVLEGWFHRTRIGPFTLERNRSTEASAPERKATLHIKLHQNQQLSVNKIQNVRQQFLLYVRSFIPV